MSETTYVISSYEECKVLSIEYEDSQFTKEQKYCTLKPRIVEENDRERQIMTKNILREWNVRARRGIPVLGERYLY